MTMTCLGGNHRSMRQTNRGSHGVADGRLAGGGLQRANDVTRPLVGELGTALRRATFVPVMEAADLRNGDDSPVARWHHGSWFGRVLLEREVRS